MRKTLLMGTGRLRGKEKELKDLLGQYSRGDGRGNVVMVRLGDQAVARIDQLVDATLFSSRSECAAFLIGAGIESRKELFDRLSAHTEEIRKLKEQLRQVALDTLKPRASSAAGPAGPAASQT